MLTAKVLGDCTMKLSTFVPSGKGKFPGVAWKRGPVQSETFDTFDSAPQICKSVHIHPLLQHKALLARCLL